MRTASGSATVVEIQYSHTRVPVFNLTVDGLHSYYVGQSGVLVHNTHCPVNLTNVSDAISLLKNNQGPINIKVKTFDQAQEVITKASPDLPNFNTHTGKGNDNGWELYWADHKDNPLDHIKFWDWTRGKTKTGGLVVHIFFETLD